MVRSVLILKNLESSDFSIGDTFSFGGEDFEIISNDRAFCLGDIGKSRFRKNFDAENSTDYEVSDVKKYVDKWFNNSDFDKN